MSERNSTIENIIKWVVIFVVAVIAIKVAFAILFIGSFLIWRLLPIIVVCGLGYMLWQWMRNGNGNGGSSSSEI